MSAAKGRKVATTKAAVARTVGPHDLDRLTGYRGTIQGTPLDTALDEQREALWLAQSIIDTVAPALQAIFGNDGGDWCANYPEFPRVLREVSRIIGNAASNLEAGVLEDRALAIARAEEVSHGK